MPIRLREHARVGRAAIGAELITIALMTGVVVVVHVASGGAGDPLRELYVPLIALAAGAAGAVFAGPDQVGYLRNPAYVGVYGAVIAVMIGVDLAVRVGLGGDLPMVFSNWAVLLGSASAVNLLVTRVPFLNVRRWVDASNISRFHPVAWVVVLLFQVGQAWVSILGAPLYAVVVQLLARRVVILGITHVISRRSYGADGARMLRDNETLEYLAVRAIAAADGRVTEPDRVERTVIGAMLLKLPILAGESMAAGRKSLTRVVDKLVFVEQMLAFSSPTMVVGSSCALGHTAFIHTLLGFDGDPAAKNPRLMDPSYCKAKTLEALRGRWAAFRLFGEIRAE